MEHIDSGLVTFLGSVDGPVKFDTVIPGADNEGWQPAMETNGEPRVWDNNRIVEGYISSERLDSQKDVVPLSAWVKKDGEGELPLIEWIAKNAELMWAHGRTDKGAVAIGRAIGYKFEKDRPKIRWGVKKGSPMIDDCWAEMQKHGTQAGFSIGGSKIEKECDSKKCVLHKLDVVEVSWTPSPANRDAKTTFINQVAKAMPEKDIEKPCSDKLKRCVEDLEREGKSEESAWAICRESVGKMLKEQGFCAIAIDSLFNTQASIDAYHARKAEEKPEDKKPEGEKKPGSEVAEPPEEKKPGEEDEDTEKCAKCGTPHKKGEKCARCHKDSQSPGAEPSPPVATTKENEKMADEKPATAPPAMEKADQILAGLSDLKKSIDALVAALTPKPVEKAKEAPAEPPKAEAMQKGETPRPEGNGQPMAKGETQDNMFTRWAKRVQSDAKKE